MHDVAEVEDLQATTPLEDDFVLLQNFLFHGMATDGGRQALDRIQAQLVGALADNEKLTNRVRALTSAASMQRVNRLEAQLAQASELVERTAAVLRTKS